MKPRYITLDTEDFNDDQIPVFDEDAHRFIGKSRSSDGGASELNDLSDVLITDPQDGEVLAYNNGEWTNTTQTGGGAVDSVNGQTGVVLLDYDDVGAASAVSLSNHTSDQSNPHTVTKAQVGLGNVTNDAQITLSQLDTDTTLAADSDSRVPSQKAVKAYVDANSGGGGGGSVTSVTASLPLESSGGNAPNISLKKPTGNAGSDESVFGDDTRLSDTRVPKGGAGGVLSGSYPNPGFAVDMATQAELDSGLALKANLLSPAFTGVPTAPTATVGTNTTQLATTAFVLANQTGGGGGSPSVPYPEVNGMARNWILDNNFITTPFPPDNSGGHMVYVKEWGKFFAGDNNENEPSRVSSSKNGTSWTAESMLGSRVMSFAYLPKKGILCASLGDGSVAKTNGNGVWSTHSAASNAAILSASDELGVFCLAGVTNSIHVSSDGESWTNVTPSGTAQWSGVAWSPQKGLFVTAPRLSNNKFASSSDGVNWTVHTAPTTPAECQPPVWVPWMDSFYVVGYPGIALFSADGTNWTEQSAPFMFSYTPIPEMGLLVGFQGGSQDKIYFSRNGTSWTNKTVPSEFRNTVAYSPHHGIIVARGLVSPSVFSYPYIQPEP